MAPRWHTTRYSPSSPLLVIIIAMIGLVFGQDAAQSYILQQLGSLLGEQSTAAIKDMIQRAS